LVYLNDTRQAPSFPNGCLNRVSHFRMMRDRIDPWGNSGVFLSCRRASGANDAAADRPVLNGKILRIRHTG
jgi:hypothetical protein